MQSPANILIGIPMGAGVAAEFFRSFIPAINLLPEEGEVRLEYIKWGNAVRARNDLVKDFLSGNFSHLFFMDSDMTFPENCLSRLLSHDLDIVGGLYTMKLPPFATTIFRNNGTIENYVPGPGEGVIEVDAIGTGCLLIKREVFEALKWPYFWYAEDPPDSEEMMTEDSWFCIKGKEAGFKVHCDTSILCGHVGTGQVNLQYTDYELKAFMEMC